MRYLPWPCLGAALLLMPWASAALPDDAPATRPYPRRLLGIAICDRPAMPAVSYGNGPLAFHKIVRHLGNILHVPSRQIGTVSDAAPQPTVMDRATVQEAIENYLDSSRAQDRVVLMIVGPAVEIGDAAYLVPSDGKPARLDTLIPFAWLYSKLEKCKARQKVLIVDVCRHDPVIAEPKLVPMGAVLDRLLAQPPQGVQVLTACTKGQYSYQIARDSDAESESGVFLNQLLQLKIKGGLTGIVQRPEDPLPLAALTDGVSRGVLALARALRQDAQTPRLAGDEAASKLAYDPAAPPPPAVRYSDEALAGTLAISDKELISLLKIALRLPPSRQGDAHGLLLLDEARDNCRRSLVHYRDDGKETPYRRAVLGAVELLIASDKRFKMMQTIPVAPPGELGPFRDKIADLQREAIAGEILKVEQALDVLHEEAAVRPPEPSLYWQAAGNFVRARLLARSVFLYESSAALAAVRRDDLPSLDALLHQGWRLTARGQASQKEAKDALRAARQLLDALVKSHRGTPWQVIAERELTFDYGLEWVPDPK